MTQNLIQNRKRVDKNSETGCRGSGSKLNFAICKRCENRPVMPEPNTEANMGSAQGILSKREY